MVKGMNWRMLPRLPCSRQSTHSSMNHCTNWVCVPAVLAPRMDEMSRKRFAVETGKCQKPGRFREAAGGQVPTDVSARWVRPHARPPGRAPCRPPPLPSTLFSGSLMLTVWSWEAESELLIE